MSFSKIVLLTLAMILYTNHAISIPNKNLPVSEGPWMVNVYYENLDQLREYAKINQPESVNRKEKYFEVVIDNLQQYQLLLSYGFNAEVNTKQTEASKIIKNAIQQDLFDKSAQGAGIPGFACYRTVEETFVTMDQLAASNPTIATIVDIGDTWTKVDSKGSSGYDMRVLKITNTAIAGPKPILFAMSSIHARELTPAELNTRFAEYLVNNYGTNADVTWLVDHREIHLLLQGNPDGRKIAETGNDKRKNENNNHCSNQLRKGVDMNRNFGWLWNQGSGSSGTACDQTFRGPTPQSELENTAIDTYIKTLFADTRGEGINDPAPLTTSGVFIDIHSFSELVLWPYGYDSPGAIPLAPNHSELRTLGRKFAWYNSYYPQASNELYGADGASDDNAYGQLGVASYTFELGTTFAQNCNTFENTIYPRNLNALIYAAKVADLPYIKASGPDIENISLSNNGVAAGTTVTVTGLATDTHFSSVNGTENSQSISSVDMFVDELPWDENSTPIQVNPIDGSFNTNSENFTATIDTTGFSAGNHVIYIQSTDGSSVTGVPSAIYINIVDANMVGTINGTVKDMDTNLPLDAATVKLAAAQTITNDQGEYEISLLEGAYTLTASKLGYATKSINNVSITGMQNTIQDIQLQALCTLLDENADGFNTISDAETAGWSHGRLVGNDDWNIDTSQGINNSHSFNTTDVGSATDKFLISPSFDLTTGSSLEFWHKYEFEQGNSFYDGAVLEISTNAGSSWQDLGNNIIEGNYNATLSNGNELGPRLAWGGSNTTYSKVEVNLSSFSNQTVQFRWRFGSDSSVGAGDWNIDDIKVIDPSACGTNDIIYKSGFEVGN